MYTNWLLKCLDDIEDSIHTHAGCFVRRQHSMLITYRVGREIKHISLPTREAVAEFLKKHGIIQQYAFTQTGLKMYEALLITTADNKGRPVQHERLIRVEWDDLTLTSTQVKKIAARHEWNELTTVVQFNEIIRRA